MLILKELHQPNTVGYFRTEVNNLLARFVPPGADMVALTSGALQASIFPAQRMDVGLTPFGVEELVEMRHNRHG